MKGLQEWRNPRNSFYVVRLHYTANPYKRTKEWFKETRRGYDEFIWNREYEISFETSMGKRVYPSVCYEQVVDDFPIIDGENLYLGWDFGYHHPACVVTKIDDKDRWIFLYEWMGEDIKMDKFAEEVDGKCSELFPNAIYFDYGDPAGTQEKDTSEETSMQMVQNVLRRRILTRTIRHTRKLGKVGKVGLVREKIAKREDENFGAIVTRHCPILLEGFLGGYHFPQKKEGEIPTKDGYYDHLQDAIQEIAANLFYVPVIANEEQNQVGQYDLIGDTKTGY